MEQYVELNNSKGILRGVMHLPEDRGTKGMLRGVIMYHGFTGNRMEPGFMFVRFSRLLAENGIASIRFDFWGSGESGGTFDKMTLSGEIEDAEDILDYFKSRDEIDGSRIFLLGLSMGGLLVGRGFIEDIQKLNIFDTTSHYGGDALIIHGQKINPCLRKYRNITNKFWEKGQS